MLNTTNGEWDGLTFVIVDFGLSSPVNQLGGKGGTPGFGSPEQFYGLAFPKSDNYAVAKTAVLILFTWQLGWNILFQPIECEQFSELNNHPSFIKDTLSRLLHVSHSIFHNY